MHQRSLRTHNDTIIIDHIWQIETHVFHSVSFGDFMSNTALYQTMKQIDAAYGVVESLGYVWSHRCLPLLKGDDPHCPTLSYKRLFAHQSTTVTIHEPHYNLSNEEDDGYEQPYTISDYIDNHAMTETGMRHIMSQCAHWSDTDSIGKQIVSYTPYTHTARDGMELYVAFLFLTAPYPLYRCINQETRDVMIADGMNIGNVINMNAMTIVPMQELYIRASITPNKPEWNRWIDKMDVLAPYTRGSRFGDRANTVSTERGEKEARYAKPYGEDIRMLQQGYALVGKESAVQICEYWLTQTSLSQLHVDVKGKYFIVSPTVRASGTTNETFMEKAKEHGMIQTTYHTYRGSTVKEVQYTQKIKVLKNGEEV